MKYNIFKLKRDSSGQALLFVVVALTIALAIGINASVRTITSLSRTSRTDTASRALAAAEGGIERYLALPVSRLEEFVKYPQDCPEGSPVEIDDGEYVCRIRFELSDDSSDEEVLTSEAYISVRRYYPDVYEFKNVQNNEVVEINLYDDAEDEFYGSNKIKICWNSDEDANITYMAYSADGVEASGGLTGNSTTDISGFYDVTSEPTEDSYNNCSEVELGFAGVENYGLRVRSIGGVSDIGIYPVGDIIPLQGYIIVSVGRVLQDQGVTATKKFEVLKTLPYFAGAFDQALYVTGSITK